MRSEAQYLVDIIEAAEAIARFLAEVDPVARILAEKFGSRR